MHDDKDDNAIPANDAAPRIDGGQDGEVDGERDGESAAEFDAEPMSPEERIAALEAELAEYKDRLLRALAATENIPPRAAPQKSGVGGFARDLLAPADNLRRALDSVPMTEARDDKTRSLLEGVAATERELLSVFERHGLKRIDPSGERFDHNLHQAIFEAENTGQPAGTVVQVLQPGYVLHDRLLRPAMVGVAKGAPAPAEGTDDAA